MMGKLEFDARAWAEHWTYEEANPLHELLERAYAAGLAASGAQHHCGNEGYCQACCERTLMRYFDKTLPDGDVKQMLDGLRKPAGDVTEGSK